MKLKLNFDVRLPLTCFVRWLINFNFQRILLQVSLLDVDICGPSIPRIVGLEGEQVGTHSMLVQTLF